MAEEEQEEEPWGVALVGEPHDASSWSVIKRPLSRLLATPPSTSRPSLLVVTPTDAGGHPQGGRLEQQLRKAVKTKKPAFSRLVQRLIALEPGGTAGWRAQLPLVVEAPLSRVGGGASSGVGPQLKQAIAALAQRLNVPARAVFERQAKSPAKVTMWLLLLRWRRGC